MRWVIVALALGSTPSLASEPLSLDQALNEALGGDPTLVSSELAKAQAEAGVTSAQAVFDPQLTVSGSYADQQQFQVFGALSFQTSTTEANARSQISGQLPTGTDYTLSGTYRWSDQTSETDAGDLVTTQSIPGVQATVSQELLRGHRTAYNRRRVIEARNSLDVAGLQLEAQRQRTLADVAGAYWTWLHATRLAEIARERQAIAEEALRIGDAQLKEGRIAPVEVTRLRAESVRARKAVVDADQAAADAQDGLLLRMGRTPGADVTPATAMNVPADLNIDVAGAIEMALEGSLELRVDELESEQATLSLKLAKHGQLPSLAVEGSASFSDVNAKQTGQEDQQRPVQTLSAGATFSVPLGNRAARGEVAQAAATELLRQQELEQRRRQVASDVAKQVRVLNAAAEQVRLADLEVEFADQTLSAEEAKASAGRNVQKDVLDARTALFDAKNSAAKARVDHQLAAVELLRLQGALTLEAATP